MSLVVPNVGEERALELLLAMNLTLRLFTNNITPGETDVLDDFTEATGNGYSSKTLTGGSWVITPGDPSEAVYAEQTFTFSGALGNVYGYYVTEDSTSPDTLRWAERFTDGPYNIQHNGDEIALTPKFTATTQ